MTLVILKRIATGVLQLLAVVLVVFILVAASPGDPASRVAGDGATVEQVAALRHKMGLDKPLLTQYANWLGDAGRGDLGASIVRDERISKLIGRVLSPTLSMVGLSLVITLVIGVIGGSIAALRPGGIADRIVVGLASFAVALPGFFLGLVLVTYFAVRHTWFPAVGYVGPTTSIGEWLKHIVLPSIALSTVTVAEVTRQLRGALTDVLQSEYIVAARARGFTRRSIVVRHGLKNAALPVLTVLSVRVSQLIGGTVVIEGVFNIEGMGKTAVNGAITGDIPVVLGVTVVASLVVLLSNLAIDVLQPIVNPRLRT